MDHSLYHFSDEQGDEFIVISERGTPEICAEFQTRNFKMVGREQLDFDATSLPCDRRLVKE